MTEPDPQRVADISARATARHAHHEAGHVVAAVARGGELLQVFLGAVDWSSSDSSGDTPGGTKHRTAIADQPFVTFAGPWAEAMWMVEHEDDVDEFYDALDFAWDNNSDGDGEKYESRVAMLDAAAKELGLGSIGRAWEAEWIDELDHLWPVVYEVAAMLIAGEQVTHEKVLASIRALEIAAIADAIESTGTASENPEDD